MRFTNMGPPPKGPSMLSGQMIPPSQPGGMSLAQVSDDHERRLAHIEHFLQNVFTTATPPSAQSGSAAPPSRTEHTFPQPTELNENGNEDDEELDQAAAELEDEAFTTAGQAPGQAYPFHAQGLPNRNPTAADSPNAIPAHHNPELIPASLTSIVRRPLLYNQLFIAAHLGLDCLDDPTQVDRERDKALAKIIVRLPSREVSDFLVERFFYMGGVDRVPPGWLHRVVVDQLFLPEHDRFWEMLGQGRGLEVDPLWIALWLLVITLSLNDLRYRKTSPFAGALSHLGLNDPNDGKTALWSAMAQRLMTLADVHDIPQARTVQCVCLHGQLLQSHPGPGHTASFLTWLAAATNVCCCLGWHKLGDDHEVMPHDDPAFPPGKNSMKREIVLRLFSLIRFMDVMAAGTRGQTYFISDAVVTSAPPSNVDHAEISKTRWELNPKPRHVLSDASFDFAKFKMAGLARLVLKTLSDSSTPSYRTVLELDAVFSELRQHGATMWGQADQNDIYAIWRRHVCVESLQFRLMRCHRPFLAKGLVDPRYAYSTSTCITAAKTIVTSHHAIKELTLSAWFPWSHILSASIILFVDVFAAIDLDLPEAQLEEKKQVLVLASELFSFADEISVPLVRANVAKGARVISGLFMAASMRRARRAGGGGRESKESFTDVLHRITREVGRAPANSRPAGGRVGVAALLDQSRSSSSHPNSPSHPPPPDSNLTFPPNPAASTPPGMSASPGFGFTGEFLDSLGLADPSAVAAGAGGTFAVDPSFDFWSGGAQPAEAGPNGMSWLPMLGAGDNGAGVNGMGAGIGVGAGQVEGDSALAALWSSLGMGGGLVGGSQGL